MHVLDQARTASSTAVGNSTVGGPGNGMVDGTRVFGIDTDREPSKETVSDLGPKIHVLIHGIHRGRFLGHDAVLCVGGEPLGVLVVGSNSLDCGNQRLVEESLGF